MVHGRGKKCEACPIWTLDGWLFDHWDIPTLCGEFRCKECEATLEDFGWSEEPQSPADAMVIRDEELVGNGIPF